VTGVKSVDKISTVYISINNYLLFCIFCVEEGVSMWVKLLII